MRRTLFMALLLTSCAIPTKPPTVRDVLHKKLQGAGPLPRMAEALPPPPQRTITLAWDNEYGGPTNWTTGLVGTVDLLLWYELVRFPYTIGESRVTLTNRPPYEFYRAFNSP